jgi:hypothetical protein
VEMPSQELIHKYIEHAMDVGKPYRPAYSELRTALFVIGILCAVDLVIGVANLAMRLHTG